MAAKKTAKAPARRKAAKPTPAPDLPVPPAAGDVMAWFERMAMETGMHPRLLLSCGGILSSAGVDRKQLTEEVLNKAARSTLPAARRWAERHNREGRPGYVVVNDREWLTFGLPPDPAAAPAPPRPRALPPAETPPATQVKPGSSVPVETGANGRFTVFGHNGSAVIRWAAQDGWDYDRTRKTLDALGLVGVSDITVRCQLRDGAKGGNCGTRGPAAKLSKSQADALRAVRPTAPATPKPAKKTAKPKGKRKGKR